MRYLSRYGVFIYSAAAVHSFCRQSGNPIPYSGAMDTSLSASSGPEKEKKAPGRRRSKKREKLERKVVLPHKQLFRALLRWACSVCKWQFKNRLKTKYMCEINNTSRSLGGTTGMFWDRERKVKKGENLQLGELSTDSSFGGLPGFIIRSFRKQT